MKNHKEPYGAIRNQKKSYGPLIWVNRTDERTNERTNERTDERTDSLLELAGFYPPAKNMQKIEKMANFYWVRLSFEGH